MTNNRTRPIPNAWLNHPDRFSSQWALADIKNDKLIGRALKHRGQTADVNDIFKHLEQEEKELEEALTLFMLCDSTLLGPYRTHLLKEIADCSNLLDMLFYSVSEEN